MHQSNSGSGGRDKIIHNHLHGSVDYQQLIEAIRDEEELLAGIAPERTDLRKQLEEHVFRLHELFTRIPINTERLRLAKAHFDRGEFRKADARLKAEEI